MTTTKIGVCACCTYLHDAAVKEANKLVRRCLLAERDFQASKAGGRLSCESRGCEASVGGGAGESLACAINLRGPQLAVFVRPTFS